MAIEKMMRVHISGDMAVLDDTLRAVVEADCFHPEAAGQFPGLSGALSCVTPDNPYQPLRNRLAAAMLSLRIADNGGQWLPNAPAPAGSQQTGEPLTTAEIETLLSKIVSRITDLQNEEHDLTAAIEHNTRATTHLTHLLTLDVPFDDLFSGHYIFIRFGRMPTASYRRLTARGDDLPYLLYPFDTDKTDCWCMYVVSSNAKDAVDLMFAEYDFTRLRVPDYAHGTPEEAYAQLKNRLELDREALTSCRAKLAALTAEYAAPLRAARDALARFDLAFALRKYVVTVASVFHLIGFVPATCAEAMLTLVKKTGADAHTDDAVTETHTPIPVRLRNRAFFRPFEMFIDMYGLPDYRAFDPTPFFAVVYTLLFGIMFGDVGQGLVISAAGFLFGRVKKSNLGRVVGRIGLSSAFFGLIYGSVFGLEGLLNPLYERLGIGFLPFEAMRPSTMNQALIYSIYLGVSMIIIAMSLNVFSCFKQKRWGEAVFSHNGVAGLMLYAGLLGAIGDVLLGYLGGAPLGLRFSGPLYTFLMILLPVLLIFFAEPIRRALEKHKPFEEGFGAFFMTAFFEMFEVLMSLFSNTLSFLRVGAFVLSHAGMMLVVMTLAQTASGHNPVVIIIGNLFVMGLEGLIVGIQVLRLTFFELFSRFYEGAGKEYRRVGTDAG